MSGKKQEMQIVGQKANNTNLHKCKVLDELK